MATNLRPLPPPLNDPLVDESGKISHSWANWVNNVYRYQLLNETAKENGTYTVGLGTTDGEVTIENGVITEVQEVIA